MSSTNKPLLVILGATGTQGGSVISHFLSLNVQPYRLRGLTRNTTSEAAQKLSAQGVEVVAADLDNVASLERAFEGATAIFSVTDFWQPFFVPANRTKAADAGLSINEWAYRNEKQQSQNIFDAAAKIDTLEHLVYSTLSDATKWSKGKYVHVYHFDSKAHAEYYAQEKYPDLWKKTTRLQVGFYLSNFMQVQFSPKKVSQPPCVPFC